MTMIYFASTGTPQEHAALSHFIDSEDVNVLISFFYLKSADKVLGDLIPRFKSTMLDSGAFSAHTQNVEIDREALAAESVKERWKEVVALDVVGDAAASLKNAQELKTVRPDCIPVFHIGEPFEFLQEYCKQFQKVGISCRFGEKLAASQAWLEKCFAAAYPHKFHSFGWVKEEALLSVPFHSADTSSWKAPLRFGRWKSKTMKHFVAKTIAPDVVSEVREFLDLQRLLRARWGAELQRLEKSYANRRF